MQTTTVGAFLVPNISFNYHFWGKTWSFAGQRAILKGWFSLSPESEGGDAALVVFFPSFLRTVNPTRCSPQAARGAEPRLHPIWSGTGVYFPAAITGNWEKREPWLKTEIPHAGGGQPLGPAGLVR